MNYIWYDCNPTEFAIQDFNNIPEDDWESMQELSRQIDPTKIKSFPNKTLLALDEQVVHRVGPCVRDGFRTFIKISISKHKFNLRGNSINYDLDYNWTMHDRSCRRNNDNKDFAK